MYGKGVLSLGTSVLVGAKLSGGIDPESSAFFLYFFQDVKIELKKSVEFPWKWCQLIFFGSSGKFLDLAIM